MDIRELAEQAMEDVPVLLATLKEMAQDAENFSPKQRVDAVKAYVAMLQLVMDRTHPRLTSSQETHVHVDFAKSIAKLLPQGRAQEFLNLVSNKQLSPPEKVIDVEPA